MAVQKAEEKSQGLMQKVLIVTYYWPPAGGPGVQRWLKFVKYLGEFSIEPIVFVPENPHYPLQDASLLDEVPDTIRIIRQPIFEPYALASFLSKKKTERISSGIIQDYQKQSALERMLLWIRGNFFIPDARKYWVKPSVKVLREIIEEEQIKTVITTGPPHSVHLIGAALKNAMEIKWLADFRDPWTSIGYHKKLKLTKASQRKHKELEHSVLNAADEIVVTSTTTKEEFVKLTPKPITVITNGYDDEPIKKEADQEFTLSHIGSLLTARNPKNLWKALAELVNENAELRSKLKIQLIGVVGDGVMESIKAWGIEDFVDIIGYVSHSDVVKYQATSQVLLLMEIDSEETRGIIPGKLFEYFNAKRPILAIGPKHWEAGEMVKTHNAGDYVTHDETETIKKLLLKRFGQFQNGILNCNSKGIEQYHRRALTQKLAKLLTWESS
jgi:glycosyltransferase involved in cell wall biosynthesis